VCSRPGARPTAPAARFVVSASARLSTAFGQVVVLGMLASSGDAATTAQNILANEVL
jgi:hypothetical protein